MGHGKRAELLHSSNPTLFEWNNSPIVYKTTSEWKVIRNEINDYFLAKAGLYHYLNTANGIYRQYLKDDRVRLKKYFYVIRPLLACKWILLNKMPPPMQFSILVDSVLEPEMQPIITDLLKLKSITSEVGEGERNETLNAYIDKNLISLKETIDALPNEDKKDWSRLNTLFLTIVG